MSRHETLLNIYGVASVPAKDTSRRHHPLFRPIPPPTHTPATHTLAPRVRPRSGVVGAVASVGDGDVAVIADALEATRTTAQRPGMMRTVAEAVASIKLPPSLVPAAHNHQQASASQINHNYAVKKSESALEKLVRQLHSAPQPEPSPEIPVSTLRATPIPTTRSPRASNNRKTTFTDDNSNSKVELVLSLYGDGFIEIPPSQAHDSALRKGFSLKIHLFKAADIEKDTSQWYASHLT